MQPWSKANCSRDGDTIVRIHGNWCGPNWTAGQNVDALTYKQRGGQFDEPCIDKLDCACRKHDRDCADSRGCSKKGDTALIKTALSVALNPANRFFRSALADKAALIAAGITAARPTRRR